MLPTTQVPSEELLCHEVLAEAARQAEEHLCRAREEVGAILTDAAAEASAIRDRILHRARAQAAHRKAAILATVPVEIARQRSSQADAVLHSLYDDARRELLACRALDCQEAAHLAAEAITRMGGSVFAVSVSSSGDAMCGGDLVDQIRRLVERGSISVTVSMDPTIEGGGLVVQDSEGRQVWDNRLLARLDRMWPEMRRQIALRLGFLSQMQPRPGDR